MNTYESHIAKVAADATAIYAVISDLRNIERVRDLIPKDKVQEMETDADFVRLKVDGLGTVTTPEQFEEKVVERVKASHEQDANYRFGADVRGFFLKKAGIELPEAFLKRWLVYANEGKYSAEDVEKEFPAFVEDFKWQLTRGYLMKKLGLKVEQKDIQEAAEGYVAYQYAMYGMGNVPQDLIKSSAQNMLQDENQVRRLEEQVEDNKTISTLREKVTLQTKKISEDKFRALK